MLHPALSPETAVSPFHNYLLIKTVLALLAVILAIAVAIEAPFISKDAQYYIQSGHLWSEGKVSYAGSLVGGRVFSVLYYYFFQDALGISIDSLSIALAVLFLAYCGSVAWLAAENTARSAGRYILILLLMLVGAVWLDWRRPLTEPFLVVAAICILAWYSRTTRPSCAGSLVLCGIGVIGGIVTGFRAEVLLLVLAVLLVWAAARISQVPLSSIGAVLLVSTGSYLLGAQAPGLGFRLFSGQPMPPQMSGYLLFYNVVQTYGRRDNGPASGELATLGEGLAADLPQKPGRSPIILGFNAAYGIHGAAKAVELFAAAGVEAMRQYPVECVLMTSGNFARYLVTFPGRARIERLSRAEIVHAAGTALNKIDRERVQQQRRFQGDHVWPTLLLAGRRLAVGALLDSMKIPYVSWALPSWVLAMIALLALLLEDSSRRLSSPVIVAAMFYIGCSLVAAFSQGFVLRYWSAASLPLLAASFAVIGRRMQHCMRPPPLNAIVVTKSDSMDKSALG